MKKTEIRSEKADQNESESMHKRVLTRPHFEIYGSKQNVQKVL